MRLRVGLGVGFLVNTRTFDDATFIPFSNGLPWAASSYTSSTAGRAISVMFEILVLVMKRCRRSWARKGLFTRLSRNSLQLAKA
jgi:hypothetical protein